MFRILNSYRICDLRVDECRTRFGDVEWFLIDEGQEDPETGLGLTIAQGSREQVADRLRLEMENAA